MPVRNAGEESAATTAGTRLVVLLVMLKKAADIVCIPHQEQKTSRKKTELLSL
jgi:hypothetical protein